MPKRIANMTDARLSRMKPKSGQPRIEEADGYQPGLVWRANSNGRITSWLIYRVAEPDGWSKPRRMKIGEFPAVNIERTRELAGKALEAARMGRDPAVLHDDEVRENAEARKDTFRAVADFYLSEAREGRKVRPRQKHPLSKGTIKQHEQDLENFVHPVIGNTPIIDVTSKVAANLLAGLSGPGVPETRHDRVRKVLQAVFVFAKGKGKITTIPTAGIDAIAFYEPRERVLELAELRRIWHAAAGIGYPHGACIRLMMLTSVRRKVAAGARWPEFDLDSRLWTIPGTRTKNRKPAVVPLSEEAVALLNSLPRSDGLVFATFPLRGKRRVSKKGDMIRSRPVSGWSATKRKIEKKMAEQAKAAADEAGEAFDPEGAVIDDWRNHDYRDSIVSHLQDHAGIAPHVASLILHHTVDFKAAGAAEATGIYAHGRYGNEVREALDTWARLLLDKPTPDNVVRLPEKEAANA